MRLLAIMALVLLYSTVLATDRYIDNAASGANNGTSWTDAYQSLTAWASTGVNPGDSNYISGGTTSKTYYERLWVNGSGTAANWITVRPGVDAGHNGKVIIDGVHTNTSTILGTPYYAGIIAGGYFTHITGLPNTNLIVYRWPTNSSDRTQGLGLYGGIPTNHLIEGVCFSNMNNGCYYAYPGRTIEIRNCYFAALGGDYAVQFNGYSGNTATNMQEMFVHDCSALLFGDFTGGGRGGPDGVQCAAGVTMSNCNFRCINGSVALGQHPDGFQSGMGNNKVCNNRFANFLNSGFKCEPLLTQYTNWWNFLAYNNVVVHDDPTFIALSGNNAHGCELGSGDFIYSVSNVVIANNTFVDLNGLAINGGTGTYPIQSYLNVNNLILNCGIGNTNLATAAGPTNANTILDYNLVNKGASGSPVFGVATNGSFAGYPPFYQVHFPTNLPSFVSYTVASTANNFRLSSSDTAAKGQGTNLSAWIPAFDSDGAARGTTWSVGAFEAAPAGAISAILGGRQDFGGRIVISR